MLVSPNGNYAEVLSKQGHKITARFGCGREYETTIEEFEKLGAKPVPASRWPVEGDYIYLANGPTWWDLDVFARGKRHELRRRK